MSKRFRAIIPSLFGILALVGFTACGVGHASMPSSHDESLAVTTHNTLRKWDTSEIFPLLQSPLSTSHIASNSASHVIYTYWQDFREIGETYSVAVGEQQAYHLLSPTLRQHLTYSSWVTSYRNVHLAQLLTLYPVSADKFYVEAAVWYVNEPATQSIGYENGFMTVEHHAITGLHMAPESLLGTVFRLQAWQYTVPGVVNEALHAYGVTHGHIVNNTEVASNILSVRVRYQHHVAVVVVTREANRMYEVLSIKRG